MDLKSHLELILLQVMLEASSMRHRRVWYMEQMVRKMKMLETLEHAKLRGLMVLRECYPLVGPSSEEKGNGRTARVSEDAPAPAKVAEFSIGLPNEIMEPSAVSVVSSAGAGLAFEGFILDERQLKRERRKQANRESARKSRLKKQAEVDELMRRYESLNVENTALKFELDQLKEDSEKLRIENAALMDKLKNTQVEEQEEIISAKIEADLAQPKNSENVPNNHSVTGNVQ
ncbi:hypothetical protein ACB098_01G145800 [Castanea mollissima]